MVRTNRNINPYAILIPSSVTLLLIVMAIAWPDPNVRRILFYVGLLVGLVEAIVCIFIGAARIYSTEDSLLVTASHVDDLNEQFTELGVRINELETSLARHRATCETPTADADAALRLWIRSA